MSDWALANTPPNAEHLVSADLLRHGYHHWSFKINVTRAHQGRIISSYRPAFPRYILVPFDVCWEVLRDVWRVLGIVCFGEEVARVQARDVDHLVERCGGSDVLPPEIIPEPYMRGERVHVGGYGLLSGHDAIYDSVVDDSKLRVMIDMMGRLVPIDVDRCDVSVPRTVRKRKRSGRRRRHREAG
jgi:transcriptional antiterminator RfaH